MKFDFENVSVVCNLYCFFGAGDLVKIHFGKKASRGHSLSELDTSSHFAVSKCHPPPNATRWWVVPLRNSCIPHT